MTMKKVAHLITYGFLNIKKGEVHCFTERMVKAKLKRTKAEKTFGQPQTQTLMRGCQQPAGSETFLIYQSARKLINVLVLSSRCLINKAIQELERSEQGGGESRK